MTDPMRVLHVITEMGTGGAEALVVQMCRLGPSVGWESAVASAGGVNAERLQSERIATTWYIPIPRRQPFGVIRATRAARRAIVSTRPDAVIAHNISATVVAWLACRTVRARPTITSVFHGVADKDYRASARILRRTSSRVVAVSSVTAERLRDAGVPRDRVVVVPNAIAEVSMPDRSESRRQLGLPENQAIALCLARMVEQKRHDVLLDAWKHVPENHLLLLAGDGVLRTELERQVHASGLQDRVRFLGIRKDVTQLLAACDLTVLSSDWEGLPIAALESLVAGRPLVATDVDGIREACEVGAVLVPVGDPMSLGKALTELLGDSEQRRQLGEAGRAYVRTEHDPVTMMRQYDELIRSRQ